MDKGPNVVRVVFKGSGSDPVLVVLVHVGGDELELHHRALGRPRRQAAPVLLTVTDRQRLRTRGAPPPRTLTCDADRTRTSHLLTR